MCRCDPRGKKRIFVQSKNWICGPMVWLWHCKNKLSANDICIFGSLICLQNFRFVCNYHWWQSPNINRFQSSNKHGPGLPLLSATKDGMCLQQLFIRLCLSLWNTPYLTSLDWFWNYNQCTLVQVNLSLGCISSPENITKWWYSDE